MSQAYAAAGQAVACSRFLPAPLIAARASVFNPMNCLDLTLTARRVLYGALTFLSLKQLKKAIFPRRDTLRAESLLQSDATLYRGLALLEAKGYIARQQIRKARNGKFYLSPITFTDKALTLLGLTEVIHRPPSSKLRDGHIEKELTNNKQSLQNTASKPDPNDKSPIDRASGLPVELLWLQGQGVSKSGLCWLMKLARLRGKRLGEVAAAVAHRITALRGREVIAYIAAVMAKDIDFAWLAKHRAEDHEKNSLDQETRRRLESLDSRYVGFRALLRDGSLLGVLERAGEGREMVVQSGLGSVPVNLRFVRAWMNGEVRLTRSEA
jgi:hypothetical protein